VNDEDAARMHMTRFQNAGGRSQSLSRVWGSMDGVKPPRFNGSMSCATFHHWLKAVERHKNWIA
jgi:hypothetical protein